MTLLALGRPRAAGVVDPDEPVLHADDLGAAARPGGVRDAPRLRRAAVPSGRAPRPPRRVGGADRPSAGRRRRPRRARAPRPWPPAGAADCVLRFYWTGGREGRRADGASRSSARSRPISTQRRARGIQLISLQLALDPAMRTRVAVAARRRQVDELRDQHGRRGRGPAARRRRRRLPLARRDRARRPGDERLVAGRRAPADARRSTSGSSQASREPRCCGSPRELGYAVEEGRVRARADGRLPKRRSRPRRCARSCPSSSSTAGPWAAAGPARRPRPSSRRSARPQARGPARSRQSPRLDWLGMHVLALIHEEAPCSGVFAEAAAAARRRGRGVERRLGDAAGSRRSTSTGPSGSSAAS